jgi:hypothetical protein
MRISTIASMFVGCALMLGLAAPAAAQGSKTDFSVGYQYFNFYEEDESLPAGWAFSVGVGKDKVKFVGDVAGNYLDGFALHTFQGGVEFSGKSARVVPFGRLLAGIAVATESGTNTAFVFTPEGGVKIMANDRVGIQASVGFPFFTNGEATDKGFRFFTGVVIRK